MAEVVAGAFRAMFIVCAFSFNPQARDGLQDVLKSIYFKGDEYATNRFGAGRKWVMRFMLIDMDLLEKVSDIINNWRDPELSDWMDNLLGSFNALSVAGSVLASVNITALSLDSVSDIHWTTRAAFAVSLITSVLSVVFATRTQRRLYLIGDLIDLRRWFSTGESHNGDTLCSSVHAIRILQLPAELLTVSWVTFVVGLVLYTALMWQQRSDPGGVDYRNIMICLLSALFMLVGYYELVRAMKDVEQGRSSKLVSSSRHDGDNSACPSLYERPRTAHRLHHPCCHSRDEFQRISAVLEESATNLEGMKKFTNQMLEELRQITKSNEAYITQMSKITDLLGDILPKTAQQRSTGKEPEQADPSSPSSMDQRSGGIQEIVKLARTGDEKGIEKILGRRRSLVNMAGDGGRTVLMEAAANGHVDLVKHLLHNGADPDAKDNQGKSARQLAKDDNTVRALDETRRGRGGDGW